MIIPIDKSERVEAVLSEAGVGFSKLEGKENTNLIIAASPENVELIINELSKIGVGVAFGRIHVSTIDVALPAQKAEEAAKNRVSTQELLSSIIQPSKLTRNFIIFAILSSVLATLGLAGNNTVVIIASMLIAPFLGPIVGISLGIVLSDKRLIKSGLTANLTGFAIAILSGIIFTVTDPNFTITPEIMLRGSPTVAELGLAIISGIALSISMVNKEVSAIVGVAIAAALVPPAANIGIGIGLLNISIALGSSMLLLVNIVSIVIVGSTTFWIKGIRVKDSIRREKIATKQVKRRIGALAIALIAFSVPLVYSSMNIYQRAVIEGRSNAIATEILKNYPDALLISVSSEYYTIDQFTHNQTVRILILVSSINQTYVASLPQEIADAVYSELKIEAIVSLNIASMARAG